ncbi:dihydrofolate reductase family protein [Corynebacterium appendicis]|uniref:dihydrofolate reductase family protein n=1 Tax=Corynebacterium appendicis TaxID=163202 RepID=UPI0021AF9192|nr:dihydrofolate reductase family protein [Corynebacterium appendicis]MCT1684364.1 dihydrofolate reductase family protein [Corynebacterium appendicis]
MAAPNPSEASPKTRTEIIGGSSAAEEVRAVAITTAFGSFTTSGTSGALGNDADKEVMLALREWADVVLVGSGTVKAEDYGPADIPIAVVSRSLDFDTSAKLFDGAGPLILAPDKSLTEAQLAPRREALADAGAELVGTGSGSAAEIVDKLRARGLRRIVCEGGPSLYATMFEASLIDVLHLTSSPFVNGEPSGLEGDIDVELELEDIYSAGSHIFARYRRVNTGN